MFRTFQAFALVLTLMSFSSIAQVERSQLTSAIEDREPVDDLSGQVAVDGSEVQTLYFFTQIKDLAGQQIVHRWVYQGREMAAVTLNIGSNQWRTYSSKRMIPQWQGDWEVQVWLDDLQLMTHRFTYSQAE